MRMALVDWYGAVRIIGQITYCFGKSLQHVHFGRDLTRLDFT